MLLDLWHLLITLLLHLLKLKAQETIVCGVGAATFFFFFAFSIHFLPLGSHHPSYLNTDPIPGKHQPSM